jgi:hypothetical protein
MVGRWLGRDTYDHRRSILASCMPAVGSDGRTINTIRLDGSTYDESGCPCCYAKVFDRIPSDRPFVP